MRCAKTGRDRLAGTVGLGGLRQELCEDRLLALEGDAGGVDLALDQAKLLAVRAQQLGLGRIHLQELPLLLLLRLAPPALLLRRDRRLPPCLALLGGEGAIDAAQLGAAVAQLVAGALDLLRREPVAVVDPTVLVDPAVEPLLREPLGRAGQDRQRGEERRGASASR
ncbi:MAG: hypothetical protein RML12_01565 [Xanthomonadales bacterium]|nr:hypothetical protein [Xanthomonadales bacterium]